MAGSKDAGVRQQRQNRVGKAVWGVLLIAAGVLFTLDNAGIVEIDGPSPNPAARAVDGDATTRWSSAWRDPQWITVDLGDIAELSVVRLHWEAAHARAYEIALSLDGEKWATVATVADGDGGIDEHAIAAMGRYVRVTGLQRGAIAGKKRKRYGYSLWELEVLGPNGELLSQGKPVRASSGEHANRWKLYWPVLLIAAGLAPLLAPKDHADRMFGVIMVAAGGFLQLQQFGVVKLSLWQALPLLFILAGMMLVLEAARSKDRGDANPDGAEGGVR